MMAELRSLSNHGQRAASEDGRSGVFAELAQDCSRPVQQPGLHGPAEIILPLGVLPVDHTIARLFERRERHIFRVEMQVTGNPARITNMCRAEEGEDADIQRDVKSGQPAAHLHGADEAYVVLDVLEDIDGHKQVEMFFAREKISELEIDPIADERPAQTDCLRGHIKADSVFSASSFGDRRQHATRSASDLGNRLGSEAASLKQPKYMARFPHRVFRVPSRMRFEIAPVRVHGMNAHPPEYNKNIGSCHLHHRRVTSTLEASENQLGRTP